jgi:hypothetical protein
VPDELAKIVLGAHEEAVPVFVDARRGSEAEVVMAVWRWLDGDYAHVPEAVGLPKRTVLGLERDHRDRLSCRIRAITGPSSVPTLGDARPPALACHPRGDQW